MLTVSRLAGVSATTVSRVFNNSPIPSQATRRKVMEVAKQVGYIPDAIFSDNCKRIRSGQRGEPLQTHTLGYLVDATIGQAQKQRDGFYSEAVTSIYRSAQARHYFLMLEEWDARRTSVPELAARRRVDGLVIETHLSPEICEAVTRRVPVVFIDDFYETLPADCVVRDDACALRDTLDYLRDLGHDNIAYFGDHTDRYYNLAYRWTLAEYCRKLGRTIVHPGLSQPREIHPETHEQVLAEYVREVLQASPRPTAIIAASGSYANPLAGYLQSAGLAIPRDISLVSMSDVVSGQLAKPAITSYYTPLAQMGEMAIDLLIHRISDPARTPVRLQVRGRLIERASCAQSPDRPRESI